MSMNKSEKRELLFMNHKVEASKLRRYLETCSHAIEQFLQLKTTSEDSIIFKLGMMPEKLVRIMLQYVSVSSRYTSTSLPGCAI